MSTDYNVCLAGDERSRNGESPFYDADSNRLIYIDYLAGDITIYTPSDNKTERIHVYDGWLSFAIPVEGQPNKILVAIGTNKLATFDLDAKSLHIIKEFDLNGRIFHDGKCDAKGRLWVGGAPVQSGNKFGSGIGHIYRFDGESLDVMDEGLATPNGLTWSNDNKRLFFAESLRGVWSFDFDLESGTITNKKLFIDLNSVVGFKKCDSNFLNGDFVDGITIDSEDNLWMASYGSSKICKFDTINGQLLETIELPVKTVTSLCFGGDDWSKIYVTTYWDVSWITDTKPFDDDDQYGKLYRVSSDQRQLKGIPMFRWRSK
ncbi:regucalcin-like [Bradysia coprophila]|uniref:regucalcin-like n=1 Tax=Bradysia coprophila TaxID=38358 RepID=UPI00187DA062|nr:regucalcin-like [Bradysia coprophila]